MNVGRSTVTGAALTSGGGGAAGAAGSGAGGGGGSGAGVSVTLTSIGAPPRSRQLPFERDEAFVLEAEQIVSSGQVLECDASPFSGRLPLGRTFDRHLDAGDRLARWVADPYRKAHGIRTGRWRRAGGVLAPEAAALTDPGPAEPALLVSGELVWPAWE